MRLIDADAVDMSESGIIGYTSRESACEAAQDYIDSLPTIGTEPVVHAHWQEGHKYKRLRTCSNCGGQPDQNPFTDNLDNSWATSEFEYCPYCGAKMDEEE